MKRFRGISLSFLLLLSAMVLMSQTRKTDSKPVAVQEEKETYHVMGYLGNSDYHSGNISKHVFDSLLSKGITCRDSSGRTYPVYGFMFGYKERNLYEDSVGNLMVLTDYLSEYCPGDSLSQGLRENILFQRTKRGDTAYLDNIKVSLPNGKQGLAKGMVFYLTR